MSVKIPNKKIVIVLPAYNAEKTLKKTVDSIPKDYVDEIILVDDCSRDETVSLSKSMGIKTFIHEKNLGYGGNQKTCYKEALKLGADIVVMVHPDFQYDPVFIPDMISPIANGYADAVSGSRMIIDGGARKGGMPLWKYIANIALTKIANFFLGLQLSEYHSGFRAYSRKVLETMPIEKNSNNFVFDTQIITQLKSFGYKIAETPITTKYFPGASMIGFFKSVEYGTSILMVLFSYTIHNLRIKRNKILIPVVNERCNICDSNKAQLIYRPTKGWESFVDNPDLYKITDSRNFHGQIVQCINCDLVYVPKNSIPDLDQMYKNQDFDIEYLQEEFGRRKQARNIISNLNSLTKGKILLDIGSGPGLFLDEASKRGYEVHGIESGNVWVDYSRNKLNILDVTNGSFEEINKYPDDYFSVITAWDVLEHLDKPNNFAILVGKKLKKNGILALSVPDFGSIPSGIFKSRWHAIIPTHINYFTQNVLVGLFSNHGFVFKKRKRYIRYFSFQYLYNRLFRRKGQSFLRNIVVPVCLFDEIEIYFIKK